METKQRTVLTLTVLTQSPHEPWRTDAGAIVFIADTSVLTAWAGLSAAGTPGPFWTH